MSLKLHGGISSGKVCIRSIQGAGKELKREIIITGEPVHFSGVCTNVAQPKELVICPNTHELVANIVICKELRFQKAHKRKSVSKIKQMLGISEEQVKQAYSDDRFVLTSLFNSIDVTEINGLRKVLEITAQINLQCLVLQPMQILKECLFPTKLLKALSPYIPKCLDKHTFNHDLRKVDAMILKHYMGGHFATFYSLLGVADLGSHSMFRKADVEDILLKLRVHCSQTHKDSFKDVSYAKYERLYRTLFGGDSKKVAWTARQRLFPRRNSADIGLNLIKDDVKNPPETSLVNQIEKIRRNYTLQS